MFLKQKFRNFLRMIAILTLALYLPTNINLAEAAPTLIQSEIATPQNFQLRQSLGLTLPVDLGRMDTLHPGHKGTIIHIQTAHGHYEAQIKIQKMLEWFSKKYGSFPIFLEGATDKLDKSKLQFVTSRPELNAKLLDFLTKKALVKGPDLFLAESQKSEGYGIESANAYLQNHKQFTNVLKSRETAKNFSEAFDREMEKAATVFTPELRSFLKRLEQHELGVVPFETWISELKRTSENNLKVDFSPAWQIKWPALVRFFKIQEMSKALDSVKYETEKLQFLAKFRATSHGSRSTGDDSYVRVEMLLNSFGQSIQLPEPATENTFVEMLQRLPEDFDFKAYPNVTKFIGMLVLQSEMKASTLATEISRLETLIAEKLARNEKEKELLQVFADYRLLEKLLALQLTPNNFEEINRRTEDRGPECSLLLF